MPLYKIQLIRCLEFVHPWSCEWFFLSINRGPVDFKLLCLSLFSIYIYIYIYKSTIVSWFCCIIRCIDKFVLLCDKILNILASFSVLKEEKKKAGKGNVLSECVCCAVSVLKYAATLFLYAYFICFI